MWMNPVVTFLILINFIGVLVGQSCTGVETFDKVTAVTLRSATRTPLYSSIGDTVTAQCNNRCRASFDCPAYMIDYDQELCYRLNNNSVDRRDLIQPTNNRINYFEKVCLNAPACEKAWMFERVIGFEVKGFDNLVVGDVSSRVECQELCLLETEFQCLSAEYVYSKRECRLSSESRRSQPASYGPTVETIDYLENQCENYEEYKNCNYEVYKNQDLGYSDIQVTARSPTECADQCDQTSAFNCRSFTYFSGTRVCLLSGDDNISAGPQAIAVRQGADYYQRSPCLDPSSSVQNKPSSSIQDFAKKSEKYKQAIIMENQEFSQMVTIEDDNSLLKVKISLLEIKNFLIEKLAIIDAELLNRQ